MKKRVGLPNKITLSRLALGPLFLIVYLIDWPGAKLGGLIIVVFSEASDLIDGWVARARGETSEIGKLIDPMADATVHLSCFFGLLAYGYAAAWMIAVLV
jgi:phosphatidylglycerophosphate synthase